MDTKALDLNLLLTLEALLSERNVTRAAKRLHLSQPALSARLSRLRAHFGDPLLQPSARGMRLTAMALDLQAPLRQALDDVRAVVDRHTTFDPATADITVSLAASDYVQYAVLAPFVLELRRQAPRIRLSLRAIVSGAVLGTQMESGDVDVALMTPDVAPKELRSRVAFTEHYTCIARVDHPRIGKRLTLDQFCTVHHVVVSPEGGGFVGATDRALSRSGRARNVVLSVAHFLMVPEIVAASDLIALVPSRLVQDRTDRLRLMPPPLDVDGFRIALLWHERTHAHPAHRWVRELVTKSLGSTQERATERRGGSRRSGGTK